MWCKDTDFFRKSVELFGTFGYFAYICTQYEPRFVMKKYLITAVSLLCLLTTASAQTDSVYVGRYVNLFPKLPPLTVDMGYHAFLYHLDPSLLSADTPIEPADSQSVMFHHAVLHAMPNLEFHSSRPAVYNGDALIKQRDWIVRKRRIKEGNPLPPPTPVFRKR